jgi:hypothetical protein
VGEIFRGGLRDVAKSATVLTFQQSLGKVTGLAIRHALMKNQLEKARAGTPNGAWVSVINSMIGNSDQTTAPADAVNAVRAIIAKPLHASDWCKLLGSMAPSIKGSWLYSKPVAHLWCPIRQISGNIFPAADIIPEMSIDELQTEFDSQTEIF